MKIKVYDKEYEIKVPPPKPAPKLVPGTKYKRPGHQKIALIHNENNTWSIGGFMGEWGSKFSFGYGFGNVYDVDETTMLKFLEHWQVDDSTD
jgi:hypothetical protein